MAEDIVLPRRAQPQGAVIVPGGDCGACVLGGLLGMSVKDAYTLNETGEQPLSWTTMRQALFEARSRGLVDRLLDDVPFWPSYEAVAAWGSPGWGCNLEWFGRVRMAIDAGYYGVAQINFAGQGPLAEHDHWVMICGAREVTVPMTGPNMPRGAARIDQEVLVSCSASNVAGYWIEARALLKTKGGYNLLLARPV